MGDATPCAGWDVRRLLNHLVGVNLELGATAAGETPPARGTDHLGSDPAGAFRASGVVAGAAFATPGMLERTYAFPWGEEPGTGLVQHVADELLIHGWDLARATGQPAIFDDDLVETSLANWRQWFTEAPGPRHESMGTDQTAPPGASAIDRLAAYMGRVVGPGVN